MRNYILIAKEDRETGEIGYMIEGTPIISYPMVATESLLISHDLLEHVNGVESIGSIDDELEALAGVWFTRGQYEDLNRDGRGSMYSAAENVASDVLNMARIYNNGVNFKTKIPNTKPCDQDDSFLEIIEIAKEQVNDELDSDEIDQDRLNVYFDACLHYMRKGWRKINKRFSSASEANSLFWEIERVLKNWMSPDFEGQQLKLSVSIKHCEVFVDEFYPEDEYY